MEKDLNDNGGKSNYAVSIDDERIRREISEDSKGRYRGYELTLGSAISECRVDVRGQ